MKKAFTAPLIPNPPLQGARGLLCLFLALLTALTLTAEERKKVAVVLSGGGAKGLAHVGALKVIEKAGIPVDIVVGTSMGSLVGGLYAIGYNAHQLDSIARSLDWMDIITDRDDIRSLNIIERERQNTYLLQRELTKDNKGGLLKGRKVITTLQRLCAGYTDSIDFDKLPIRYSCIATDLADKTEIDIHSGSLPLAMRASMAIPAVFTPVRQDGKVLVDGGFTNDYPVDVARKMGADIVIGVTVVQSPQKAEQLKSTSNVIMQVLFFNILNKFEENIANTDLYIPVNTTGYTAGSFGKTAVDSLIQRGEQQAMSQWDEMLKLKEQIGISSTTVLGDLQSPHCFRGFAIPALFEGICNPRTVLGDLQSPHPSSLTPPSGGRGASRRLSLALRADNEELVAMQVNASIPIGGRGPGQWSIHSPFRGPGGWFRGPGGRLEGAIRLGKRIKAGADLTLHPCTSWPFLATALSYHFHHNDINLYHKGKREYNILYNRHETQLQPLSIQLHDLIFSAGLRWDYYNFVNELQRVGTSVSALESSSPFRGPGGRLEGASSLTPPLQGAGGPSGGHYLTWQASLHYNTEDDWYFPTRGTRLKARYAYITDNFTQMNHNPGISDVSASWRQSLPLPSLTPFRGPGGFSPHPLSLSWLLYGRMLFGKDIPIIHQNIIGGTTFAHYLEQQMPMPGMGYAEFAERHFAAIQLQAQQQLGEKHYVSLLAACAQHAPELKHLLETKTIVGAQLAYAYSTMFGPLGASIGYCTRTKSPYLQVSLGYDF